MSQYSMPSAADNTDEKGDVSRLVAFYLPQYHRIEENSQWWGPGFTEWTNVAGAKPNFVGHYQPHIPRELGFYDLTHVESMREQTELAREYGLHGFCFYYYWFSGRRILERPLDNFLASDIDFPFCLCWANENWTRTWDGLEKEILLKQIYAKGDEERFIQDIYPFLADPRYLRVDGKPMLLVYRIKELPDPAGSIKKWRDKARRLGLGGLHVVVFDYHDLSSPQEVGADAMVEFPPQKFVRPENWVDPLPQLTNPDFCGRLLDYTRIAAQGISRPNPSFSLYRGITPGWDNTARRQNEGTIIVNATPKVFSVWLWFLRIWTREYKRKDDDGFIFVNAWNEWGEGCHLEPDIRWGLSYLEEVVRSSHMSSDGQMGVEAARECALRSIEKFVAHQSALTQAQSEMLADARTRARVQRLLFLERIKHVIYQYPFLYRIIRKLYRVMCWKR